jgi:predicted CXXCH cytochrome family protein
VQFVPPSNASVAKPTVVIAPANCVTSQCHATVKSFKVVHGPVNVNSCDACHNLVDAKVHRFELSRAKADLCTFCHQTMKPNDKFVHKPVADGDCIGCHNPHGGESKKFLHGRTMSELCNRCHSDVAAQRKMAHGPVGGGACDSCHQPHSSKFPKLVNAQGSELCFNCHDQMKGQFAAAKFVHKAVTEKGQCLDCHEVHASDHVAQLKTDPLTLCTSCHEPVKQVVIASEFKHSATVTGKACLNCHAPHGGNRAKLMKADPIQACLACHDKKIEVSAAHVVPSMAILNDPKQFKHGPLREGDCSGCHLPHGGPINKLLAAAYPEPLYQPFSIDKYALCFSCHDKNLALQEKTTGLTKFRNGEQNLHYLHVNKQDKGRSCRACHATHTSAQPLHLRDTVPFGKWEMPIQFRPTPTGGSCSPGCHQEMRYDRNTPFNNHLGNIASAPPKQ